MSWPKSSACRRLELPDYPRIEDDGVRRPSNRGTPAGQPYTRSREAFRSFVTEVTERTRSSRSQSQAEHASVLGLGLGALGWKTECSAGGSPASASWCLASGNGRPSSDAITCAISSAGYFKPLTADITDPNRIKAKGPGAFILPLIRDICGQKFRCPVLSRLALRRPPPPSAVRHPIQ